MRLKSTCNIFQGKLLRVQMVYNGFNKKWVKRGYFEEGLRI